MPISHRLLLVSGIGVPYIPASEEPCQLDVWHKRPSEHGPVASKSSILVSLWTEEHIFFGAKCQQGIEKAIDPTTRGR